MHAGRAGVLNHTHTCGRLRLRSHIGSNRIRTHSKPTFTLQRPGAPIPSTCLRRQNGFLVGIRDLLLDFNELVIRRLHRLSSLAPQLRPALAERGLQE